MIARAQGFAPSLPSRVPSPRARACPLLALARLVLRAPRARGACRRGVIKTVVDLAHHIVDVFELRAACPNGVALSVDGFALLPAQTTDVVRENDTILYALRKHTGRGLRGASGRADMRGAVEARDAGLSDRAGAGRSQRPQRPCPLHPLRLLLLLLLRQHQREQSRQSGQPARRWSRTRRRTRQRTTRRPRPTAQTKVPSRVRATSARASGGTGVGDLQQRQRRRRPLWMRQTGWLWRAQRRARQSAHAACTLPPANALPRSPSLSRATRTTRTATRSGRTERRRPWPWTRHRLRRRTPE